MVHHIFGRLDTIPEPLDSPYAAPGTAAAGVRRLQVSPAPSRTELGSTVATEAEAEGEAEGKGGTARSQVGGGALEDTAASVPAGSGGEASAAEAVAPAEGAAVAAADAGPSAEATAAADADAAAAVDAAAVEEPAPASPAVVSLLPALAPGPGAAALEGEGYGVDAVREVLLFIISLIGSGGWRGGRSRHAQLGAAGHVRLCTAAPRR